MKRTLPASLCSLLLFVSLCRECEVRGGVMDSTGALLPGFHVAGEFKEQVLTFRYPEDVCITVNAPCADSLDLSRRTTLIFYALPNGNTTDQTAGRQLKPGDDWHYDIQHIAAQTRFLRHLLNETNVVTVYLETGGRSWPAWRSRHPDSSRIIISIVDTVKRLFGGLQTEIVLSGHSGGGSFIFGYLNGMAQIPDEVERIALLDADYAYEDSLHADKLVHWLDIGKNHHLCVLAYNDSVALLDGRPFVSLTGGTWHRSHMMMRRLSQEFPFRNETRGALLKCTALGGRVQFMLMENPDKAILHTIQVERNGFIQSIVSGTTYEEKGYTYFGDREYNRYISR